MWRSRSTSWCYNMKISSFIGKCSTCNTRSLICNSTTLRRAPSKSLIKPKKMLKAVLFQRPRPVTEKYQFSAAMNRRVAGLKVSSKMWIATQIIKRNKHKKLQECQRVVRIPPLGHQEVSWRAQVKRYKRSLRLSFHLRLTTPILLISLGKWQKWLKRKQ